MYCFQHVPVGGSVFRKREQGTITDLVPEVESRVFMHCMRDNMRDKSSARPNVYFHITSDVFNLNNNNEGISSICHCVTVRFNHE